MVEKEGRDVDAIAVMEDDCVFPFHIIIERVLRIVRLEKIDWRLIWKTNFFLPCISCGCVLVSRIKNGLCPSSIHLLPIYVRD